MRELVCMLANLCTKCVCVCVCACAHARNSICACVHACVRACARVRACVRTSVCLFVCLFLLFRGVSCGKGGFANLGGYGALLTWIWKVIMPHLALALAVRQGWQRGCLDLGTLLSFARPENPPKCKLPKNRQELHSYNCPLDPTRKDRVILWPRSSHTDPQTPKNSKTRKSDWKATFRGAGESDPKVAHQKWLESDFFGRFCHFWVTFELLAPGPPKVTFESLFRVWGCKATSGSQG